MHTRRHRLRGGRNVQDRDRSRQEPPFRRGEEIRPRIPQTCHPGQSGPALDGASDQCAGVRWRRRVDGIDVILLAESDTYLDGREQPRYARIRNEERGSNELGKARLPASALRTRLVHVHVDRRPLRTHDLAIQGVGFLDRDAVDGYVGRDLGEQRFVASWEVAVFDGEDDGTPPGLAEVGNVFEDALDAGTTAGREVVGDDQNGSLLHGEIYAGIFAPHDVLHHRCRLQPS
jgi:hypothetical protein